MDARQTDATETMAETSPTVSRVGLTLVHHPDRSRLGERFEIAAGTSHTLGRGNQGLAAGQLDDRTVSKRHATLGALQHPATAGWIEDHDSRNGTRVNGVEVSRAQLRAGDVLALGRIMFVVDDATRPGPPMRAGAFLAFAPSTCAVLRVSEQLDAGTPRWIWGPIGAGKTELAHAWSPGTTLVIDARAPGQWDGSAPQSVIVEHVDDAEASTLEALSAALAATRPRSLVFVSTRSPALGAGRFSVLEEALAWSFHLPALAERPADIAAIAWSCAEEDPAARPLSPQLLLALQSAAWPTNAAGARAVVERAKLESVGPIIDVFGGLSELLRPSSLPIGGQRLRVADSCAWFEGDGAERADLSRNPLLRRVLALLVQHHQRAGDPLGVDAVFAHAWPDEQASSTSRTNRVYVALTKLRKAGLKAVLERTEHGYRLDPNVSIEVVRER